MRVTISILEWYQVTSAYESKTIQISVIRTYDRVTRLDSHNNKFNIHTNIKHTFKNSRLHMQACK